MVVPPDRTTLAYRSFLIHITLHDGLESGVVDASCFLANEAGLEENLRASETLTSHSDDVSIRQLICFLLLRALCCLLHLSVEIQRNVRKLLLDVPDNLPLRCGGERVTTLCQDFHHVLCEVTACQVQAADCMGQGISLVDRHSVGHSVT